jgi:tetratricopeptide (TPR) repeat protein
VNRLLVAGTAAVSTAAVLLLGGVLRHDGDAAATTRTPSASAEAFAQPYALGDTAAFVTSLQNALRRNPRDVHAYDLLGLAYEQRARETGDSSFYAKADGVLHHALALGPHDFLATSGLGSLALSRHRFREALALGLRAHRLSPSTARNYGVVGDALVELGRYGAAFRAFDMFARVKPGVASYARVSYARELRGDTAGAVDAMRLAQDAAVDEPEATAWTHVQLGKLLWNHGRLAAAARQERLALSAFPGYVYAYDALAQVEAARGRIRRAIALEQRAVDAIPLPQFVGTLGDLHRIAGNLRLARTQYATIGVIERLLRANGVRTDLETALFDVDHGVRLSRALALARVARRDRPSIDGDDVLAWALERNGRCVEARTASTRSLRLGTLDGAKFFHRGMIERCLGNDRDARRWFRRALALNPHFSLLWAPVARRYAS